MWRRKLSTSSLLGNREEEAAGLDAAVLLAAPAAFAEALLPGEGTVCAPPSPIIANTATQSAKLMLSAARTFDVNDLSTVCPLQSSAVCTYTSYLAAMGKRR